MLPRIWSALKAFDFSNVYCLRKEIFYTSDELLLSFRLLDLLRGEAHAIDRLSSLGIKVYKKSLSLHANVNANNFY